jgi:hypothetical protein
MQGVCETLEKQYLRLTLPPHPSTVRPQRVLEKALQMMKSKWEIGGKKEYKYLCDQLKSIRQDCTLQALHNNFVIEVYETHARMALNCLDLSEFIQCLTQLKNLYAEVYHQIAKEEETRRTLSKDTVKPPPKRRWTTKIESTKPNDKGIESQYAYITDTALNNEVEFTIYRLFYFVVMKNPMEVNNSLRAIRSMKQNFIKSLETDTAHSTKASSSSPTIHLDATSTSTSTSSPSSDDWFIADSTMSIKYIDHALECHCALNENNFFGFFHLLPTSPFQSKLLLDTVVDSVRFQALATMQRAYGKTSVTLTTVRKSLGFPTLRDAYDYLVAQNGKINQQGNDGDDLANARWLCSESILEEKKMGVVESDSSVTHALI